MRSLPCPAGVWRFAEIECNRPIESVARIARESADATVDTGVVGWTGYDTRRRLQLVRQPGNAQELTAALAPLPRRQKDLAISGRAHHIIFEEQVANERQTAERIWIEEYDSGLRDPAVLDRVGDPAWLDRRRVAQGRRTHSRKQGDHEHVRPEERRPVEPGGAPAPEAQTDTRRLTPISEANHACTRNSRTNLEPGR